MRTISIFFVTILLSIQALFSANCTIPWTVTGLSNTTALVTGVTYTLTSSVICGGGGGIGSSGIPAGNLITINLPTGTDASAVTTGTFNGFPITFITTTAIVLTFNAPVNAAKGTMTTIILNNITNPSLVGTYSNLILTGTNNSSGTTTFKTSNYTITPGPCLLTNLIPNPSFENFSVCPTSANQITNATSWINPNTKTPDFHNACAGTTCGNTIPFVCVPSNWSGSQLPNTGNGYAGIFVGSGDPSREYIEVQLACPLIAGNDYVFSYYISLADGYNDAIDRLGAYFSSGQISGTNQLNFTPQIISPAGLYITDKVGWTFITETFTAIGGEQFMTFGNFKDELNTTSIPADAGGGLPWSYYYIDDISLVDVNVLPVELISFSGKNKGTANDLSWSTATEINNDYFTLERSGDAINFTEIKKINGAGNSNTLINYRQIDSDPFTGMNYYRLKQTDFNGDFSYSNIVAIEFKKENELSIYPNPSSDFITLKLYDNSLDNYVVQVYNTQGKMVINQQIKEDKVNYKIDINYLNKGIYFIRINNGSDYYNGSFFKQ